jgi:hypothetical protein
MWDQEVRYSVVRRLPQPPGLMPPTRWGTEDGLNVLLGAGITDLHIERRHFLFRFRSPEPWLEVFRQHFDPRAYLRGTRRGGAGRICRRTAGYALLSQPGRWWHAGIAKRVSGSRRNPLLNCGAPSTRERHPPRRRQNHPSLTYPLSTPLLQDCQFKAS